MSTRFRRIASIVLTVVLTAGSGGADSVQVEATRVNVRKEANTTSPIVTTVARGEQLEVLERAGDWYRIKTGSGAEGYVSARLVRPSAAPGAASAPTRPAAPAATATTASPPAAPWKGDRPVIVHKDVGCVVAGEFPKLEACFTPAESVGRAQVQFRADEKGPWYYVNMKEEGGCRSALLPKPKKDIATFHYFIEVVDRSFTAVQQPASAPSESYAPRVVANRRDCGQGMMMATSTPTGSVIMGVARDAGGKVLQAAIANSAEATASISGFSAEGVSMASTGAAPGGSAGSGSSAGGLGTKTLVIAGGVVGAGALVAVAAGGGGESGKQRILRFGRWRRRRRDDRTRRRDDHGHAHRTLGRQLRQRRRLDGGTVRTGVELQLPLGHHLGLRSIRLELQRHGYVRAQGGELQRRLARRAQRHPFGPDRVQPHKRSRERRIVLLPGGDALLQRDLHRHPAGSDRQFLDRGLHGRLHLQGDEAVAGA